MKLLGPIALQSGNGQDRGGHATGSVRKMEAGQSFLATPEVAFYWVDCRGASCQALGVCGGVGGHHGGGRLEDQRVVAMSHRVARWPLASCCASPSLYIASMLQPWRGGVNFYLVRVVRLNCFDTTTTYLTTRFQSNSLV